MPEFDSPSPDELSADQPWWQLYEASFPPAEREPAEVILESVRRGVGLAIRARSQDSTIGLATTHLLLQPPAVFLVYLAIHPDHRSRGLGSALLDYAWRASAARLRDRGLDPLGMIWEVDPPSDTPSARRVAFFQRCGASLLPQPYLQPPVDGIAPIPMRLMYLPNPETIDALIRTIYSEKYAATNHLPEAILHQLLRAKGGL